MEFTTTLLLWFHFFLFFNFIFLSLSVPFSPAKSITLYGDARFRNNSITLTQEQNCSVSNSSSNSGVGRALYRYPIRFVDPKTKKIASFSIQFSFSIIPSPTCSFGDGIAFLITSNPKSFSLYNGYMGLPAGRALNPKDSFFAVEFDTSHDRSLFDINNNHIGIDVNNTVVSFASVDVVSEGIDLRSGRKINSWIEYIDSDKLIQVWVNYLKIKPPKPIIVSKVDLSEYFKEFMHVGFSASNGEGSAVHVIDYWRFNTTLNTTEEYVCFVDSAEAPNNNDDPIVFHDRTAETLVLAMACLVAYAFAITVIYFVIRQKKCNLGKRNQEDQIPIAQRGLKRFSIEDIMIATVGFSPDKIIREGGSATMYRGFFRDLGTFAVKRFQLADWFRHQSISKFATMAYYLRHNNLVQLRGWCYEEEELVFVYEYLRNGNLDGILHNNTSSPIVLSWKHRLNIVLGVASALSYLHEECEEVLIHGDVRTSGIFLDEKFNAKLGDFGVAYIYKHCPVTFEKTGYSAPEYLDFGIPSVKTDVYSFGVVVLEVATGKKPIEDDGTMLVDWVRRLLYQGKLLQAADSKLEGKFDELEMERLLGVGIDCVHPHPQFRPKVREAVNILIGQATNPDGPDTNEGSWVSPSSHFSSGTSREI